MDPAWVGVQTGADKIAETVDPVLKKGLGPIMEARDGAKAKVKCRYTMIQYNTILSYIKYFIIQYKSI